MHGFDDWALTLAVFLPAVGAVVLLLSPKSLGDEWMKFVALAATVLTGAVGVAILAKYDYGKHTGLQFEQNKKWIDVIHARYQIGIDGISLPLLILSMFICVLV